MKKAKIVFNGKIDGINADGSFSIVIGQIRVNGIKSSLLELGDEVVLEFNSNIGVFIKPSEGGSKCLVMLK